MSREWVDDAVQPPRRGADTRDKRWVMRCDVIFHDGTRCPTEGEPSREQPDLEPYAAAGWFIANVHGDACPECVRRGLTPDVVAHPLMNVARPRAKVRRDPDGLDVRHSRPNDLRIGGRR